MRNEGPAIASEVLGLANAPAGRGAIDCLNSNKFFRLMELGLYAMGSKTLRAQNENDSRGRGEAAKFLTRSST
jgi:hypothetical protein